MEDLKKEFEYYLKNMPEMLQKYQGKWIVIKDQKVVGVFDNNHDAITETSKTHQLGTFLVQHVVAGQEKATFRSRVA